MHPYRPRIRSSTRSCPTSSKQPSTDFPGAAHYDEESESRYAGTGEEKRLSKPQFPLQCPKGVPGGLKLDHTTKPDRLAEGICREDIERVARLAAQVPPRTVS